MEITNTYQIAELIQFKELVLELWPQTEFPNTNDVNSGVPAPILAREEGLIVGGLSYIRYPNPDCAELALWINTLLVIPSYRHRGVGSALITFAMQDQPSKAELYVYTTVPNLYLKLGWQLISVDKENHVLKFNQGNIYAGKHNT